MTILAMLFGVVVGAVGVLVWNYADPAKVAKFTAKHKAEIERELADLKARKDA